MKFSGSASSTTSNYAIAMIIAIGAASFMFYLWITEGGNFRRKGKFAKNEGPTKVPPELMNVRSSESIQEHPGAHWLSLANGKQKPPADEMSPATGERSSPNVFVRLGRAPEALTMFERTDLAVS
ncbi:hypothetical protein COOONC_13142 [Cooperia oncophora]